MQNVITHTTIIKEKDHDAFDWWAILLPVVMFVLGYIIAEIINKKNRKNDSRQNFKVFESYLAEQTKANVQQLQVIDQLVLEISNKKSLKRTETILHPFHIYDAIDKVKLLQSYYALKKDSSDFMTKTLEIERTRAIVKNFDELVANHVKLANDLRDEWNTFIKELQQGMALMSNLLEKNLNKEVLNELIELMDVCSSLNSINCEDYDVWQEKYHRPLKQFFIRLFKQNSEPLEVRLVGCIDHLEFIAQKRKHNILHFVKASTTLKKQLQASVY